MNKLFSSLLSKHHREHGVVALDPRHRSPVKKPLERGTFFDWTRTSPHQKNANILTGRKTRDTTSLINRTWITRLMLQTHEGTFTANYSSLK